MTNKKCNVTLDPNVLKELEVYASASGLKTANTLLAAAAVELSKAAKKGLNVWHVLGRIAADDTDDTKRLPAGPRAALMESR